MSGTTSGKDDGRPAAGSARTRSGKAKRRIFLDQLAATCNVRKAATAAGATAGHFYSRRQVDAEFDAGWQAAVQAGYDRLEEALLARALEQLVRDQPDAAAIVAAVGGERGDDPAAPPRGRGRAPATVAGLADKVARVDVQLALALLARRAAVERPGREPAGRRRPTAAEVESALNAKLDALARRIASPGGHGG